MIMVIGVIAFSFASGSLASILQNYDTQNAKMAEQLNILNKIYKDYCLPFDLYSRLRKSVKYNSNHEIENLNSFVSELPHNLKIELSLYLHEDTYKHIHFLKDEQMSLIAWICPLLKTYIVTTSEYIYFEGDEVLNLQIIKEGSCAFVLPKFNKVKYINIKKGSEFGAEDIISTILKNDFEDDDEWIQNKDQLIRQFTVMADQPTELLLLSISDLRKLQSEFVEAFNRLLEIAYKRLEFILLIKLDCSNQCQE